MSHINTIQWVFLGSLAWTQPFMGHSWMQKHPGAGAAGISHTSQCLIQMSHTASVDNLCTVAFYPALTCLAWGLFLRGACLVSRWHRATDTSQELPSVNWAVEERPPLPYCLWDALPYTLKFPRQGRQWDQTPAAHPGHTTTVHLLQALHSFTRLCESWCQLRRLNLFFFLL